MVVRMDDLTKLWLILAERSKERGLSTIELDGDWYWTVGYDDREKIEKVPELAYGSLIDDMQEIQQVLEGKRDVSTLELDRLANIIIAVSHQITRSGCFLS